MVVDFALHLPKDKVVSDAGSFLSMVSKLLLECVAPHVNSA